MVKITHGFPSNASRRLQQSGRGALAGTSCCQPHLRLALLPTAPIGGKQRQGYPATAGSGPQSTVNAPHLGRQRVAQREGGVAAGRGCGLRRVQERRPGSQQHVCARTAIVLAAHAAGRDAYENGQHAHQLSASQARANRLSSTPRRRPRCSCSRRARARTARSSTSAPSNAPRARRRPPRRCPQTRPAQIGGADGAAEHHGAYDQGADAAAHCLIEPTRRPTPRPTSWWDYHIGG